MINKREIGDHEFLIKEFMIADWLGLPYTRADGRTPVHSSRSVAAGLDSMR
jgi:hypothetical protein